MRRVLPNKSTERIELLMVILDKDGAGHISKSTILGSLYGKRSLIFFK